MANSKNKPRNPRGSKNWGGKLGDKVKDFVDGILGPIADVLNGGRRPQLVPIPVRGGRRPPPRQ